MLNRIKRILFDAEETSEGAAGDGHGEASLAAAALLVEAAMLDSTFADSERHAIERALREKFGLTDDEVKTLIGAAEHLQDGAAQLLRFTRTIKDSYDEAGRTEIIEMLWEVAYADGTLHDYEANLLRRVTGLLYVPDRLSGEARKRVLDRLQKESK